MSDELFFDGMGFRVEFDWVVVEVFDMFVVFVLWDGKCFVFLEE